MRRWRNKRHARAMRAWTEHVWESKSRRDALDGAARTMGVCVAAWSRKKVYGAFRTWSRRRVHLTSLTDAARRLHRIRSQSLRRLRFLHQGRGFATWSRFTHSMRMLDSVHSTHRHMLSRIVKKWILRTQSVCWRTWCRRVVLLRLLAKSVMRLVRREVSRGLTKWISVLKRDKRAKAALRRVLTMWTKSGASRARSGPGPAACLCSEIGAKPRSVYKGSRPRSSTTSSSAPARGLYGRGAPTARRVGRWIGS